VKTLENRIIISFAAAAAAATQPAVIGHANPSVLSGQTSQETLGSFKRKQHQKNIFEEPEILELEDVMCRPIRLPLQGKHWRRKTKRHRRIPNTTDFVRTHFSSINF
jgi:hypothetical protein